MFKNNGVKSFLMFALLITMSFGFVGCYGCKRVEQGYAGVKYNLYGSEKGDMEVVTAGKYFLGWNEEMEVFPVFKQNYVWTYNTDEGKPVNECVTFQTKEGLESSANVGITFSFEKSKLADIFVSYKRGVDEIRDVFLRNTVRDAFNTIASKLPVEYVYGIGKESMMKQVDSTVKKQLEGTGIKVEKIYLVGRIDLPDNVRAALNAKIEATQKAEQRENELREAEAQAKKLIAEAEGIAKANAIKQNSITPQLLQYEAIKKWDGKLPQYSGGGAVPFVKIN